MSKVNNINILSEGWGKGPSHTLLASQFSFRVHETGGLSFHRYLCKKTGDQTMFFLVLFFCTKNIRWVLGLKREERLRCRHLLL